MQRNRKVWRLQRKKNKSTETVPEKDLMTDTLNKDFKDAQRTKKDVENVKKKKMCKQNGNNDKEKTKKILELKKYNN